MEIYFAGSIRGAEADKPLFKRFIEHLSSHGKVLTEHSFDFDYSQEIRLDDHGIYELDTGWLKDADALVAEVSSPSRARILGEFPFDRVQLVRVLTAR